MCSKVLNGHIILTDTSITTILAPEMTYTPKITYHQPTYLKGKPDRECSMSGVNHKSVSYRTATEWGDERQI